MPESPPSLAISLTEYCPRTMPRRGFVLVQTGLNEEEWSRVSRILERLGWSTYRLVKTALLEFVDRHEKDRK